MQTQKLFHDFRFPYEVKTEELKTLFNSSTLGINYPVMNTHGDPNHDFWLRTAYDTIKVEEDLKLLQEIGIKILRVFAPIDAIFNWDDSTGITEPNQFAENLHDFLYRAERRGIKVVLVMALGNYSLDDFYSRISGFKWEALFDSFKRQSYINGAVKYINKFKRPKNIIEWELQNEPYGDLTWSPSAIADGVTKDQVHKFLVDRYRACEKVAGDIPVTFSELQEEEQEKYRIFNDGHREKYVDECTDVYSMHVYRPSAKYLNDWSYLTAKPKQLSEVGNLNYYDPITTLRQRK